MSSNATRLLILVLSLLLGTQESCKPPEPPKHPPPAPPSASPAVPPAALPAPRIARTFLEGTWLSDQGAFIIPDGEDPRLSGIFLPFGRPCAFFRPPSKGAQQLTLGAMGDGDFRWKGSLELTPGGKEIKGSLSTPSTQDTYPCRGFRIGGSAGNGVPALLQAILDDDAWVRECAAGALGALGPAGREAVPQLVGALGDENEAVRRRVGLALVRLGKAPERSVPGLCCHLKSSSPPVRVGAAEALGEMGSDAAEALPSLMVALEDPDPTVKAASLIALGKIGSPSGEALLRALKGEDPARVAEVVDALQRGGAASQQVLALLAGKLEGEAGRGLAAKALSDVRSSANAGEAVAGKDWPQWRGPDKDNVSKETGLLPEWPKGGPPLAWEVWGIGESIAAVSVREGRVFALGFLNGWEYVTALDARTGRCLWTAALGPGELENSHMRWVAQRTPTIGRERVYVMLASGHLVALRARDGKEEWRVDYLKEFGKRQRDYGFVDHPIEEEDRLICTPASEKATLAALDLTTGRVRWTSKAPDVPQASCPSTVTMDLAGTRQYVLSAGGLYGFRASDGKFLWSHDGDRMGQGWLVRTPIPLGDSGLLVRGLDFNRVTRLQFPGDGGSPFQAVYTRKQRFGWLQDTSLVSGAWHYVLAGSTLEAVGVDAYPEVRSELQHGTGNEATMVFADGKLYVLGNEGRVALVEVSGKDMKVKSTFEIPMFVRSSGTSNPVIAQGRLYVRDSDRVLCYDLRTRAPSGGSAAPSRAALEPPVPPPSAGPLRAAFVPTPHDVVNRMLSLAKLRAEDTLFDLGSGDGRILLAAAKNYKAKAVGYEIDPELVATSRREVEKRGYSEKIRIEEADLFTADLSAATVVALYLPEELMTRLKPQLERLKPGTRIVSHQFRIPGVVADKEETFSSLEDGGRHTDYLWTTPLRSAER